MHLKFNQFKCQFINTKQTMKVVKTFSELFAPIKSDMSVFIHGQACTPITMIKQFVKESDRLKNIELLHMHTQGNAPYTDPKYAGHFRVSNLFCGKNMRGKVDFDRIDYLPCFLSQIPALFRKKIKKLDVAMVQVSPPDQHGNVSLGLSVDAAKAAVQTADLVLAQINRKMPRVHGDGFFNVKNIDYAIQLDQPIYSHSKSKISDVEMQIGRNVASLVEDGATLQLGIGSIPDATCFNLKDRKNLGIHTEMWSDGALQLIKLGVVNNSLKKTHRGKVVSCFIIGSQELYKFVDDNMTCINLEASYTNNPVHIIRNSKVTAINSAVQIDLTGQVCADSIGSKIISGVGGQMDFMRAASLSEGGKPIIALPSSSKGISKIVTKLKPGAGVVTTRSHVHYVVTQYGIAHLYGKTLGERAKALINIAHPDHRENLAREFFNSASKQIC